MCQLESSLYIPVIVFAVFDGYVHMPAHISTRESPKPISIKFSWLILRRVIETVHTPNMLLWIANEGSLS